MKKKYVLAFDAGTNSTRAILFDHAGDIAEEPLDVGVGAGGLHAHHGVGDPGPERHPLGVGHHELGVGLGHGATAGSHAVRRKGGAAGIVRRP